MYIIIIIIIELKKALQNLKSKKGDLSEIKYVSRTLRDRLRNNSNDADDLNDSESLNHNKYLERSFWGYVKNISIEKTQYYHNLT